jgi:hypothetical protein
VASNQPIHTNATEAEAETKLQEALARMKSANDRHTAVIAVVSRVGATPGEKRFAQSESKKVDRELRDAKRLLQEAQAFVRSTKKRKPS